MTTFSEMLIEEQSNPVAKLLEIIVEGQRKYQAIAAIEGSDDKAFYFSFLGEYLPNTRVRYLDCKGKPTILKLKELTDGYEWNNRPTMLFLCDKDFDDFLNLRQTGVFYLSYYSIENYFGCPEYLSYIIEKYSSTGLSHEDLDDLKSKTKDIFGRICNRLVVVSAYMMELRRLGEAADFDKILVKDLFDLKGALPVTRRRRLSLLNDVMATKTGISLCAILHTAKKFRRLDHRHWLRGKLAMQVARIALDLASKSHNASAKMNPVKERLSKTHFGEAKQYLGDLPELKNYCEQIG